MGTAFFGILFVGRKETFDQIERKWDSKGY